MRFWVVPIAAILVVGATGCADRTQRIGQGSEVFEPASLLDLAQNSDLIVQGTVVAVGDGRTVGPTGAERKYRQVTLQVESVLRGEAPAATVLLEEGWWGFPDDSSVGDTGIYFLHRKREDTKDTFYRLTSSSGRFLQQGDQVVASNDEFAWAADLEELTIDELKLMIEEAVASPTPTGGTAPAGS